MPGAKLQSTMICDQSTHLPADVGLGKSYHSKDQLKVNTKCKHKGDAFRDSWKMSCCTEIAGQLRILQRAWQERPKHALGGSSTFGMAGFPGINAMSTDRTLISHTSLESMITDNVFDLPFLACAHPIRALRLRKNLHQCAREIMLNLKHGGPAVTGDQGCFHA